MIITKIVVRGMILGILLGLLEDELLGIPLPSVKGTAHDLNCLQSLRVLRSWHYQQLLGKLTPKRRSFGVRSWALFALLTRLLSHLLCKKGRATGAWFPLLEHRPSVPSCIWPLHSSPQDFSRTESCASAPCVHLSAVYDIWGFSGSS